jgi:tRNA U34 5-methylaminomethyl-2-thiouridine-forming methyltransferase MnmC
VERKLILTRDGSHSISIPEMNVTYHSVQGAIQESMHVFIEAGLKSVRPLGEGLQNIESGGAVRHIPEAARRITEMGFGTGLNALLTLIEAEKQNQQIIYTAIELYPLHTEEVNALNYCKQLNRPDLQTFFEQLHQCEWEKDISINPFFIFHKTKTNLINYLTNELINLIYFDAFAPNAQPELWTKEIFEKLYNLLSPGGILVTYCSKGNVRRAMQAAGFDVEKIPGPPGKREMIRAVKADSSFI